MIVKIGDSIDLMNGTFVLETVNVTEIQEGLCLAETEYNDDKYSIPAMSIKEDDSGFYTRSFQRTK